MLTTTLRKVPSSIVLGPPKTAFASSSALKTPNRPFDSPNKSAFGSFGGDTPKGEYFGSKSKYSGEKEGKEDRQRELRTGGLKGNRDDVDSWSGPRSGRNFGTEDEKSYRRFEDREVGQEPGDSRDNRRQGQRPYDNHRRDSNRDGDETRRNGNGRGSRPSWYRDDENQDLQARENVGNSTRIKDWREGEKAHRRGFERDWNRGTKSEQDPEWMLEPKSEDKKEKHTAQDIEQWKASMKAQAMGETAPSNAKDHTRNTSNSVLPKDKPDIPLALDHGMQGMDKFFSFWDEPKVSRGNTVEPVEHSQKQDSGRANVPKSSRFTGFFSPQPNVAPTKPESQPQPQPKPEPQAAAPPSPPSLFSDAISDDKEGFQRMLQMLRAPQPSTIVGPPDGSTQKRGTPPHDMKAHDPPQSPPILSPRSRRSHGLENLLGLQSPREGTIPQNKDSEFLLNLMRQDQSAKQTFHNPQRIASGNASGRFNHQNNPAQSQLHSQSPDDSKNTNSFEEHRSMQEPTDRAHDKLNPNSSNSRLQRQHVPFEDNDDTNNFPPFSMGVPSQVAPPPGLGRPPGFDQPPPGFPPFMPQQQRSHMAPPPGFPAPPRNANPNQFPPGLVPNMGNLNLGNDRGPPPFGMPQIGPGPGPGPGPGLGPAPFMSGPPFPPRSGGGFPMVGSPYGNGPGNRPLPMDLFNDLGGNGGGRGGPPPNGQFRRPE